MNVRQPAVAGMFYPQDRLILEQTIKQFIAQAEQYNPPPKALIVPHAGYIYSGYTAAQAYASLQSKSATIKKIVLLGPAHTMYFKGIAYDPATYVATPLGDIEQDTGLLAKISSLPYVYSLPQAHQKEHCLEVQWPFCQVLFNQFTLLSLVVGETEPEQVAELLELVWGGDETLIIISSDLSHYLAYNEAQKEDTQTCLAISTLNFESLIHHNACGFYPLRGFLHYARQHQLCGRLVDLRNSGDTAGSKERVVGYSSYHFYQNLYFADYCGDELLYLAKKAIELQAKEQKSFVYNPDQFHDLLHIRMPTFVTLEKNGMLRGCIGNLHSQEQLGDNVIHNAIRAGFNDPRFPKVTIEELNELSISISILSPMETLYFEDETDLKAQLRQGIDGLVLNYQHYQATFLPSVWHSLNTKDAFIGHLKLKMGLPIDFWSPEMKAVRYTAEIIKQ